MVSTSQFEYAHLGVRDIGVAVDFYTDVMGLSVIDRQDGTTFLGCGLDRNVDLAVSEGEVGLDHYAIRVADDEFDAAVSRLDDHGVEIECVDGPGVERGIAFPMPMGATMELVTVADTSYHHSNMARLDNRHSSTPVDVDHVTFGASRSRENAEFLRDTVGFEISEVLETEDGEWGGIFTRFGNHHHDVAFISSEPEQGPFSLRHVAWTMESIDQMKSFIDRLSRHGHQLEVTMHRHYAGNNLAAYFVEPGGNRFEICTEMATLKDRAPTKFTPRETGFTAWGGVNPPESYRRGTPPRLSTNRMDPNR